MAHGASAATDVTGFGLLGHLLEMLNTDQGAALSVSQIPLLAGALKMTDPSLLIGTVPRTVRTSHGPSIPMA